MENSFQQKLMEIQNNVTLIQEKVQLVVLKKHVEMLFVLEQNQLEWLTILQFGNPEDPEIFWTFLESLKGLTDFAKDFKIPCVGGKVSLYNETPKGPIKPTPLIGVLGLIDKKPLIPQKITKNDCLIIVGDTKDELGGSEYFEYIHKFIGGKCPAVDFKESKKNMKSVLRYN